MLGDVKIFRQYYDATGAYKYEYVESIPEDQTGEEKEVGSEVVSFIPDFIPILSNIKAAIEAFSGEDLITGREIGDVERAVLAAAILGGPIVKGAQVVGKAAMKQLLKVKNVLHPNKVKSLAKDFYDDYIQKSIQKGASAFKDLVKKVADLPMPFSSILVTANGMSVTKTIGESMTEAKESVMQMAGKVKESVSGKGIDNVNHPIRTYRNADLKKLEEKYTADPRITVEMPYVG
ncbi:MAG: pre-toxin TG domain-containing protein [Bacillus sp. (in: firmicutes)]